jgi:hypothetical protein
VPFGETNYYADEMGEGLLRQYVSFRDRVDPGVLAAAKLKTNAIEDEYRGRPPDGGRRRINLDPGYLSPSRLVLASGKDFSHRIYIGRGIYAELTVMFNKQGCRFMEWTYPDYKSDACQSFLLRVRRRLIDDDTPRG